MAEPLDPAAIMAEHEESYRALAGGNATHCVACYGYPRWPCLPYRLAAELAEAREQTMRLLR